MTYRRLARHAMVLLGAAFFVLLPGYVHAQQSLSLSVTPPLFQLNAAPGDVWQSAIKVINNNPYELTLYAEVYDLVPKGEEGLADFRHREGGYDAGGPLFANWIDVSSEPIVVPPEQSKEIPVRITLPQNASPGGHFAAVFVGTRPTQGGSGSMVRTAQVVTSLFFLRVAGDVVEKATIREFSVAHLFREMPEADFSLRFENTGNVHVQPQGQITVRNMWGKERGVIPVNQNTRFGNVLPQSIRRFDFSWKGEASLADIGRYSAEATLTFGESGRQNTSSILYFWVIPFRAAALTLGFIAAFVFLVVFSVRRYIHRAMLLAGYSEEQIVARKQREVRSSATKSRLSRTVLIEPIRVGVLDMRKGASAHAGEGMRGKLSGYVAFVLAYRLFFLAALALLIGIWCIVFFFTDVLQKTKSYDVIDRQKAAGQEAKVQN